VTRVRVAVQAADHLSLAGLVNYLGSRPEVIMLEPGQRAGADVAVVAVDRLSIEVVSALRRAAVESRTPVVLVTDGITEEELLTAVECRVVAVLPRSAATGERVLQSVLAAASGGGVLPPNLLAKLLKHVEREQGPQQPTGRLSRREVEVLRLMADGMGTAEIASQLSYSERTIKNVFYGLTTRLNLRNRPHAVAYALRKGMI
jgi:DNA-binding NarL/FixJ family response regulator